MKFISPTGSYKLILPDDIQENIEDEVSSYWRDNSDILLQVSSHMRFEGEQINAKRRMQERLNVEGIKNYSLYLIECTNCSDLEAIYFTDQDGCEWIYCYLVWPDLSLFITVSAGIGEIEGNGAWVLETIQEVIRC